MKKFCVSFVKIKSERVAKKCDSFIYRTIFVMLLCAAMVFTGCMSQSDFSPAVVPPADNLQQELETGFAALKDDLSTIGQYSSHDCVCGKFYEDCICRSLAEPGLPAAGAPPFADAEGFNEYIGITPASGDPTLISSMNDPIWIDSVDRLRNIGNESYAGSGGKLHLKTGYYKLNANITIPADVWDPICNSATPGLNGPFAGTLDGNGRIIGFIHATNTSASGVVTAPSTAPWGVIGYAEDGATFLNITIHVPTGVVLRKAAGQSMGAMVGQTEQIRVENCRVTGGGKLEWLGVAGTARVGGLMGNVGAGTVVRGCSSTIAVDAGQNGDNIGGLIGNMAEGRIQDSFATGAINGRNNVGGLRGSGTQVIVSRCYATGNVTGNNNVGGFIGLSGNAREANNDCFATGNVVGNDFVGGFVGRSYGNPSRSYATGNVTGGNYVGGFAGQHYYRNLADSAAYGSVTASGSFVGGFVGEIMMNNSASIARCLAAASSVRSTATTGTVYLGAFSGQLGVTRNSATNVELTMNMTRCVSVVGTITTSGATTVTGGLFGYRVSDSRLTITGYFYHRNTVSVNGSSVVLPAIAQTQTGAPAVTNVALIATRTQTELQTQMTYASWTTANWNFPTGQFPRPNNASLQGMETRVTHIVTTRAQLEAIGGGGRPAGSVANYNSGDIYILGGNITIAAGAWNPAARTADNAFTGMFYGDGYTVSMVSTASSASGTVTVTGDSAGILGYVDGALIRDLTVHIPVGVSFVGSANRVGAIVGSWPCSIIANCQVKGSGTVRGMDFVGGVAGWSDYQNTALFTTSTVNVSGRTDVGGAFGYIYVAKIFDSWVSGNVTATGDNTGGFAGRTAGNFTRVAAFGNVTAPQIVGGFVGYQLNGGSTTDCFAIGNVTLTAAVTVDQVAGLTHANTSTLGGFIGTYGDQSNTGSYTMTRCYAYGDLIVSSTVTSGFVHIGGLIGGFFSHSNVARTFTITSSVAMNKTITRQQGVTAYVGSIMGVRTADLIITANRTTLYNNAMAHRVMNGATQVSSVAITTSIARTLRHSGQTSDPVLINGHLIEARPLTTAAGGLRNTNTYTVTAMGWDFLSTWRLTPASFSGSNFTYKPGADMTNIPIFRSISPTIQEYIWLMFTPNGGSIASGEYEFGLNHGESNYIGQFTVPTAQFGHWRFTGWWTASVGGTREIDAAGVIGSNLNSLLIAARPGQSVVLYAQWEATIQYSVRGQVTQGAVIQRGVSAALNSAPAQGIDGWNFTAGQWYFTALEAYQTSGGTPATITAGNATTLDGHLTAGGNLTLYARMTTAVGFNLNYTGAPANPSSITTAWGGTYGTLSNPVRMGYTFAGWWTGDGVGNWGTQIVSSTTVGNSASGQVLYGRWTANTYRVSWNYAGATSDMGETYRDVVYDSTYGAAGALPSPLKTGYTFGGWWTGEEGAGTRILATTTVAITGPQTLYAYWTAVEYLVDYAKNTPAGASAEVEGTMARTTHTYDADDGRLRKNVYTLEGWTFAGWNTEANGSGFVYPDEALVKNLMGTAGIFQLYAQWTPNQYFVIYLSNRPFEASNPVAGSMSASDSFTYDAPAKALTANAFSIEGWVFTGWRDADGRPYADEALARNLTLTPNGVIMLSAQWRRAAYSVEYRANRPDGAGAVGGYTAETQHEFDTWRGLRQNGFSLIGWNFMGWSLTGGEEPVVSYADEESVRNLIAVDGGTVELFAVWQRPSYTLTFLDWNGSVFVTYTAGYGSLIEDFLPPGNPDTRGAGWEFNGWSGVRAGLAVTSNHFFVADYIRKDAAEFDAAFFDPEAPGNALTVVKGRQGQLISELLPAEPSHAGRTFLRWDGYEPWMRVTGNHYFTAVYGFGAISEYTLAFVDWDGRVIRMAEGAKAGESVSKYFPADPSRANFVFSGWAGYVFGMAVSDNHTFTAVYRPNVPPPPAFTVTFLPEAGEEPVAVFADVPAGTFIDTLIPAAPYIAGKIHIGWSGLSGGARVMGNHTFRAMYVDESAQKFSVTFFGHDGISVVLRRDAYAGTPVSMIMPSAGPERSGWEFTGWRGYRAGMVVSDDNHSFTAMYEQAPVFRFNVIFLDEDGSVLYEAESVPFGTLIAMLLPTPPTKEGRTFVRWAGYESWMMVMSSYHIFTAVYMDNPVNTFTVQFLNWNGALLAVYNNVLSGTSVSALFPSQDPIRAGWVFAGWSGYSVGMTVNGFTSLTASYAISGSAAFAVRFVSDNALIVEYPNRPQGTPVAMLLPPVPFKIGWEFDGWEYFTGAGWQTAPGHLWSDLNDTPALTVTAAGEITLRAKWKQAALVYEVIARGAVGSGLYRPGNTVTLIVSPPTGYEFDDWALVTGFSSVLPAPVNGVVTFTMPFNSVTVEAGFKPIEKFTVVFDANGGWNAPAPQEVWNRDRILPVRMPELDFHIFLGWFYGGVLWDFVDSVSPEMAEDGVITLTAEWRRSGDAYFVQIAGASGGGWYLAGNTVTVELLVPANQEFIGWVNPEGVFLTETEPDIYTFIMPNKALSLTAVYQSIPYYTVTFVLENGTGVQLSFAVKRGDTIADVQPAYAQKDGYEFQRWIYYLDEEKTQKEVFTVSTPVTANVTLYAEYLPLPYAVAVTGGDYTVIGEGAAPDGKVYFGTKVRLIHDEPGGGDEFLRFTSADTVILYDAAGEYYYFYVPAHNVAVTAHFGEMPAESHVIEFHLNNESNVVVRHFVEHDGFAGGLEPPALWAGYTFLFWYQEVDGPMQRGTPTPFDLNGTPITDDLVLLAFYARNDNTVNVVGGSYEIIDEDGDAGDGRVYFGTKVMLEIDAPAGKRFVRFSSTHVGILQNEQDGYFYFVMPDRAVTITAVYEDKESEPIVYFTVIFQYDNGTGIVQTFSVESGDTAAGLLGADPTLVGHRFVRWYLTGGSEWEEFELSTPIVAENTVEGVITLRAFFEPESYSVTATDCAFEPENPEAADGGGKVFFGAKVILSYEEDEGKIFLRFESSDVVILYYAIGGGEGYFYFFMPAGQVGVRALFVDEEPDVEYFIVIFDLNNNPGGTSVRSRYTVEDGTKVSHLEPNPSVVGFSFVRWYLFTGVMGEELVPFDFDTPITGNITLMAHYTQNSFEVQIVNGSYVLAEGGKDSEGKVYFGSKVVLEYDAPPAGKIFVRFTSSHVGILQDEADGYYYFIMPDFSDPDMVVVVTAVYGDLPTIIMFTVTFVLNDGSAASVSEFVANGSTAALVAPVPYRRGYEFLHWYVFGGNPLIAFEIETEWITGNTVLVAHYAPLSYSLTVNGGAYSADNPAGSGAVYFGSRVALTPTPPAGQRFVGWIVFADEPVEILFEDGVHYFIMPDCDVTVTAGYENIPQYAVMFDYGGGLMMPRFIIEGGNAEEQIAFPITGYAFAHWYLVTGEDGEELVPFNFAGTPIVAPITLRTHYTRNVWTLSVDNCGFIIIGGDEGSEIYYDSAQVEYGTKIKLIPAPPAGMRLLRFISNVGLLSDEFGFYWYFDMPNFFVTISALYVSDESPPPPVCTVEFDPGNGGEILFFEVDLGQTVSPIEEPDSPAGYRFLHWYLVTGEPDSELMPFNFIMTPIFSYTVLRAHYEAIDYRTVTFDFDNDEDEPVQIGIEFGETIPEDRIPEDPVKEGYTFLYWYEVTGEDGEELVPFDFETPVTGELTLRARYEANTSEVLTVKTGTNMFEFIYFDRTKVDRNTYVYDEDITVYLVNVAEQERIDTVLSQFVNDKIKIFEIFESDGVREITDHAAFIGTGMIIRLYNAEDDVIDSVTLVIRGDANGDGWVSTADTAVIMLDIRGTVLLEGAFFLAADVNNDGWISTADTADIMLHMRGTIDLHEGMRVAKEVE